MPPVACRSCKPNVPAVTALTNQDTTTMNYRAIWAGILGVFLLGIAGGAVIVKGMP